MLKHTADKETIKMATKNGSLSTIYIRNSFADLPPLLHGFSKIFLIVDKNVDQYAGNFYKTLSENSIDYSTILLDISEDTKTLDTISIIMGKLLEVNADRECLLLGLGGGITTDIAGFAASIYKRGVKCAYIPTTLLADVDAAVGGKTGVNYRGLKNVIGVFQQPLFTYLDIRTLTTLPKREFLSGAVEMLKTFILTDEQLYNQAIDYLRQWNQGTSDEAMLRDLIIASINIKKDIVEQDEKEGGKRRLLNLGHTFAHAIEKCTQDKETMKHGEAVAIGMIYAAKLSVLSGFMKKEDCERLEKDLISLGYRTNTDIPEKELFAAIRNDKKCEKNSIYFVYLNNIGAANVSLLTLNDLEKQINDLY